MHRALALAIVLCFIPSLAASHPAASTATIKCVVSASVMVETDQGRGSGTVIGRRNGGAVVLTCQHVIDGATKIQVIVEDELYSDTYEVKVLDQDKDRDLALLLVPTLKDVAPLPIAKHEPNLYNRVL